MYNDPNQNNFNNTNNINNPSEPLDQDKGQEVKTTQENTNSSYLPLAITPVSRTVKIPIPHRPLGSMVRKTRRLTRTRGTALSPAHLIISLPSPKSLGTPKRPRSLPCELWRQCSAAQWSPWLRWVSSRP